MTLTPSNHYINTSTVAFTPTGGSLVALTGIKSISMNEGIEVLQEGADADFYPTVGGAIGANPSISLTSNNAFSIYATIAGAYGVLVYTANDFTNAATTAGGAKITTMSNAFLASRGREHPYHQLATQALMFHSTSTDGSTSPLAIAAA